MNNIYQKYICNTKSFVCSLIVSKHQWTYSKWHLNCSRRMDWQFMSTNKLSWQIHIIWNSLRPPPSRPIHLKLPVEIIAQIVFVFVGACLSINKVQHFNSSYCTSSHCIPSASYHLDFPEEEFRWNVSCFPGIFSIFFKIQYPSCLV